MIKKALVTILSLALSACATTIRNIDKGQAAATLGELQSGYTYIPVDPFPVDEREKFNCQGKIQKDKSLLNSLPDNAIRMLVERFDKSGAVTYGGSRAGLKDESYRVTVDYINADTINVPVSIAKFMVNRSNQKEDQVNIFATQLDDYEPGTERYEVFRIISKSTATNSTSTVSTKVGRIFNIPVYVGVGLRVSSHIYVTEANANISGLGVIGAEAEANRLRGSLTVQTLGVNGKSVAAALPIQSELNRTTAQNAIVAVGSIKALLYSKETITSPRVVGLYLPFPGGKALVNALVSELSQSKDLLLWEKSCLVTSE